MIFGNNREGRSYNGHLVGKVTTITILHLVISIRTAASLYAQTIDILRFGARRAIVLTATNERKRL